MQEQGETPEAFHAALTAQAARSELGTLKEEILRDLFISKIKNMTLQNTLTFETLAPEEVLSLSFPPCKCWNKVFQDAKSAFYAPRGSMFTNRRLNDFMPSRLQNVSKVKLGRRLM